MVPSAQQTILIIHASTLDPYPFVQRLIESPESLEEDTVEVPWKLDNKYYTTDVTTQVLEVGPDDPVQAKDIPVVIYLFHGSLDAVPATVVKLLMAEPRDIALAIRIAPSGTDEEQDGLEGSGPVLPSSWEAIEEMFEEVGMEAVDEAGYTVEEDDERPISPLEQIRQTLMTHMWPEMVRKPLGRALPIPLDELDDSNDQEPSSARGGAAFSPVSPTGPSFPIIFNSPAGPSRRPTQDTAINLQPSTEDDGTGQAAFPNLDELRAQIQLEHLEQFERGGMSRLDAMDDEDDLKFWDQIDERGLGAIEYGRLDDWLDGDDEAPPRFGRIPQDGDDDEGKENDAAEIDDQRPVEHIRANQGQPDKPENGQRVEDQKFDDDFEDFAPFQSAPTAPGSEGAFESLDPTPLLLHLQNIRSELAGVTGEDERRVRAGKEVARVMRDLGLGGDFNMDDLDGDEPDQYGRA